MNSPPTESFATGAEKPARKGLGAPPFFGVHDSLDGVPVAKHSDLPIAKGMMASEETLFGTKTRSVLYTVPLAWCSTCLKRKTGWVVGYGTVLKVRECWNCQDALTRRLIENINRVNDGKEPLPVGFPSRESP